MPSKTTKAWVGPAALEPPLPENLMDMLHRAKRHIRNIENQDGPDILDALAVSLANKIAAQEGLRGVSRLLMSVSVGIELAANAAEAAAAGEQDNADDDNTLLVPTASACG